MYEGEKVGRGIASTTTLVASSRHETSSAKWYESDELISRCSCY
jgi:hypothetical protein